MITPNIAPRKITGSAAAGLFSAAKSSIRRMEKTTDAISKAPDVTKEQKFGINYVQFFGSKKNSKILKKSLKSIRDSLVATFEIAKLLRSEVSKNVKLIGEKTKGNKGFFGLGLGGILGLVSLLANPIVLSVLGIGAGLVGGGFLINFLIKNRDKIAGFIMDKAKGLYNTLQGIIAEVLRDFFGDRFKDPATRNLEIQSENRIEAEMDQILEDDKKADKRLFTTKAEARDTATKNELKRLEKRKDILENKSKTAKEEDELDATKARIKQLKTGENVFDKEGLDLFGRMAKGFFQKEFQREPVFLRDNEDYLGLSKEKKLEKIKGLIGNFRSKGNSIDRIEEVYRRAMDSGELTESQMAQAADIVNYADRNDSATREQRKKNKQDPNITPDNFSFADGKNLEAGFFDDTDLARVNKGRIDPRVLEKYPNLDPLKAGDYSKLKRLQKKMRSDGDLGLPLASNGGVNGKPNLSQVPVEASSSPSCRYYSNFDGDNDLPGFNRSLLCIT